MKLDLLYEGSSSVRWSQIPSHVQSVVWSWNAIPANYDRAFPVRMVDVRPLYQKLTTDGDFASSSVYDEEWKDYDVDLTKPIMLDRRFAGQQANVTDGLHRIMVAYHRGVKQIPAIDLTPMFLELGLKEPRNDYPTAKGKKV